MGASPRAFSLLEVMMASALFLAGVSAVLGVQATATSIFRHHQKMAVASSVAGSVAEQMLLRVASDPDLSNGDHGPLWFDREGSPLLSSSGAVYFVTWKVQQSVPVTGMREIKFSVRWGQDSQQHHLPLLVRRS